MKKFRVYGIIVAVLAVSLVVLSLGTSSLGRSRQPLVGLTTITLQAEFFQEINRGAEDAAKDFNVNLLTNDPQYNALNQISAIENFLQRGVNAVVLLAVDPIGIVSTVEDVADQGVPVIAVDAVVDSEALTTFIGTANEESGRTLGRWVVDYVERELGGSAKVGIVSAFNSVIQLDRQKGFVEELEKAAGIEIVAVTDGKNLREEALSAAENLLTANPQLDIIYGTGEPAVLGSLAAVSSQNRNEVKIVGWDLTEESIQGIKDGAVAAMIQQNPYLMGYYAVENAVKVINGETVDANIGVPVEIYTIDNIDQF